MAVITGTDASDRLSGTSGDDVISALGANDVIIGSAGMDAVDGGTGNDILQFSITAASGAGPGDSGFRLFTVSGDRTSGGRVADTGGRFDTRITSIESLSFGNSGRYGLTIDATASRGVAINLFGSDQSTALQTVLTGAGDDRINASRGLLNIDAGAGDDFVSVATSGYTIAVQNAAGAIELHRNTAGGDVFTVIANAEHLNFYASNPSMGVAFDASALDVAVFLQGSDGNDQLIGGSADDEIQMRGRGGDVDFVAGGLGADTFYPIGFDLLSASTRIGDFEGRDRIDFSSVVDFDGNPPRFIGNDAFSGRGNEYRASTDGRSTVIEIDADGDQVADSAISLGDRGFLLRETGTGSNVLEVDTAVGLRVGTLGADTLQGDGGANFLFGYADDDRLEGGAGNDLIEGGTGDDLLLGGTGADVFLFDYAEDSVGHDRIGDFGSDDILLTSEALSDSNGDGRITFGGNRMLDLLAFDGDDQGQIAITAANGSRVTALEYDGFVDAGDIRYFVYSRVGSSAGTDTLIHSDFFDLLG